MTENADKKNLVERLQAMMAANETTCDYLSAAMAAALADDFESAKFFVDLIVETERQSSVFLEAARGGMGLN